MEVALRSQIRNSETKVSHYKDYLTDTRRLQIWLSGRREYLRRYLPFLADNNAPQRALPQLPTELFLLITNHLSPPDLLALQDSSPLLPQLIPVSDNQRADRIQYSLRLHQDLYDRACQEEAAGHFPAHMLCSYCLDLHAPHLFTAGEQRTPAARRLTHAQLAKMQVAARLDGEKDAEFCMHSSPASSRLWAGFQVKAESLHASRCVLVLRVGPLDIVGVMAAVMAINEPVCPHMHTSNLRPRWCNFVPQCIEIYASPKGMRWDDCGTVRCVKCHGETECILLRREVPDEGLVLITLIIGKVIKLNGHADDPSWLAQVE